MAKTGFRETMWFKLGDVTTEKREAAGEEEAAVPLPIEDRYAGSVSADDTASFGLHTGTTEYLRVLPDAGGDNVSMKSLVGEMKYSKSRLLAIGASVCAAITVFALYVAS